ncbi:MAG: Clp protease N-terminal domain-containing protein [Dehalococcoidia bacterium]
MHREANVTDSSTEHQRFTQVPEAEAFPLTVQPDADGGLSVSFPDLPGCVTHVTGLGEIEARARQARSKWLDSLDGESPAIRAPSEDEEYSGRFNLRLPRSLHHWLAEAAAAEGVSLNLYVATLLARGDSQSRLDRRLEDLSWQKHEAGGPAMSTIEGNKAVVRRFYEDLWNQGKLAVADQILDAALDPDGFKQYVAQTRAASGYRQTIEDLIAENDRVVAVVTGRGTRRKFLGFAGAGVPFTQRDIIVFRVRDGKIVERTPRWEGPQTKPLGREKFDKFTDRAQRVLVLAQHEAQGLRHNYLGTEHILLGLIREGDGVAAKVLQGLGLDLDQVRFSVRSTIGEGDQPVMGEIGLTPRSKKVISLAAEEAKRLNHHYIGTEHLLLGLLREGEGIASGVLESLGLSLEQGRAETLRTLSQVAPPSNPRNQS